MQKSELIFLVSLYLLADDPKSETYSENDGWQFVSLGDQVSINISLHVVTII